MVLTRPIARSFSTHVDDAVQAQVVVDEEQHKSTYSNSGSYTLEHYRGGLKSALWVP